MKSLKPLVLTVLLVLLSACQQRAVQFNATDITGTDYGKALELQDQFGKTRRLADFKGKVTLVFFGYTQCPDVCPTTLVQMVEIKKQLGRQGKDLQVVFVTVDPERDTPQHLQRYMAAFDPAFVGLRGTPEQTARAANDFKILHEKRGDLQSGRYTVDHTSASFVFDREGRPRLFVRYGETTERLLADIRQLLDGA